MTSELLARMLDTILQLIAVACGCALAWMIAAGMGLV